MLNSDAVTAAIANQLSFINAMTQGSDVEIDFSSFANRQTFMLSILSDMMTSKIIELEEELSKELSLEDIFKKVTESQEEFSADSLTEEQEELLMESLAWMFKLWHSRLGMEDILVQMAELKDTIAEMQLAEEDETDGQTS